MKQNQKQTVTLTMMVLMKVLMVRKRMLRTRHDAAAALRNQREMMLL